MNKDLYPLRNFFGYIGFPHTQPCTFPYPVGCVIEEASNYVSPDMYYCNRVDEILCVPTTVQEFEILNLLFDTTQELEEHMLEIPVEFLSTRPIDGSSNTVQQFILQQFYKEQL